MPYCPNCRQLYDGERCPTCDRKLDASRGRRRLRNENTWPVVIAFVLCVSTLDYFHLVDHALIFWMAVAVFAAPIIAGLIWTSLSLDKLLWCDVAALILFSFVIVGNCVLDKAAPARVSATVIGKWSPQGRTGHSYGVTVKPSWRPPRTYESLSVAKAVYDRIHDEEAISIDIHPGYFHLPWYDQIAPVGEPASPRSSASPGFTAGSQARIPGR